MLTLSSLSSILISVPVTAFITFAVSYSIALNFSSCKEDCIEITGEEGTLCFSAFSFDPITLTTSEGTSTLDIPNPTYVQQPIIKAVVEALQGIGDCTSNSESATSVNWVLDRILGKF